MQEIPVPARPYWTWKIRHLGMGSANAMLLIGILYLATIALWLFIEATPLEPIGDPYLALMEVLTILSALALLGFVSALGCFADQSQRVHAMLTLILGAAAAVVTTAVHFVQLTAVRQLWRAGHLSDYRLVWPSSALAVEYFAWDILVGATMLCASFALAGGPKSAAARGTMLGGGVLCLAGLLGPISGRMLFQNIAVAGYAILLPMACALSARSFRASAPSSYRATQ